MLAHKQPDAFYPIEFKDPTDLIPGAELKRALYDQIGILLEIELFGVVFLEVGLEALGNLRLCHA